MTTTTVDRQALANSDGLGRRLNWLRAGVMGANDGIVSTAGMVIGVAGASLGSAAIIASGVAATVAGALSMAVGEYVSVSSQRDTLVAHAGSLDEAADGLTNPWHAAWASMIAFVAGALVPLLAVLLAPGANAVPVIFGSVLVALAGTGSLAAHLGRASKLRSVTRTVLGGLVAMAVTYGIGSLVGLGL